MCDDTRGRVGVLHTRACWGGALLAVWAQNEGEPKSSDGDSRVHQCLHTLPAVGPHGWLMARWRPVRYMEASVSMEAWTSIWAGLLRQHASARG